MSNTPFDDDDEFGLTISTSTITNSTRGTTRGSTSGTTSLISARMTNLISAMTTSTWVATMNLTS